MDVLAGPQAQKELSRQPTKVASFSVPHDAVVLQKAREAVYAAHSYEEPVIYVSEVANPFDPSG